MIVISKHLLLALYQGVWIIQEVYCSQPPKSHPRPSYFVDRIPHRADVLWFGEIRYGNTVCASSLNKHFPHRFLHYRFFERIAKTYRREKWGLLLRPLLSTWYSCAQQLGDVELSVRLLVEMLGHGFYLSHLWHLNWNADKLPCRCRTTRRSKLRWRRSFGYSEGLPSLCVL